MRPSTQEIATQLSTMLRMPWPEGPDDGLPWLQGLGVSTELAGQSPTEDDEEEGRSWGMAPMPGWGTARAGWSTSGDEVAGVFWFLWEDGDWSEVKGAAAALAQEITEAHGAPEESTEETVGHGPSWWWRLPEHSIELYAHNGDVRPEGFAARPPVVQLHVDRRTDT